jgi:hypothetical protein
MYAHAWQTAAAMADKTPSVLALLSPFVAAVSEDEGKRNAGRVTNTTPEYETIAAAKSMRSMVSRRMTAPSANVMTGLVKDDHDGVCERDLGQCVDLEADRERAKDAPQEKKLGLLAGDGQIHALGTDQNLFRTRM